MATKREPRKPKTDFVLVRMARDANKHVTVSIVQATAFDFTDYRYLRMCPSSDQPVEEWVHKSELKAYKQATGKTRNARKDSTAESTSQQG